MKERKNIFLLIGALILLFPLCTHILNVIAYVTGLKITANILLLLIGNVAVNLLPMFISSVQIICNQRNKRTWVVPVVGIALSGYYFVMAICSIVTSLPSFQIHVTLNLLSSMSVLLRVIANWVLGVVGHIVLLIGYIKSLPQKRFEGKETDL